LRNGIDYNQSITVNPATFPNGTILAWSYPSVPNDNLVYTYPDIEFGQDQYNKSANHPAPMQVGQFSNLTMTHNLTGSYGANDTDVMHECWSSTDNPSTVPNVTNEISFLSHTPQIMHDYIVGMSRHFSLSAGGLNFYIGQTGSGGGTGTPGSSRQTCIMPVTAPGGTTAMDFMVGTWPVLTILKALVTNGWLSNTDYISGMEFGAEPACNSGSLTFNSVSMVWN
jgi:hypothetical protein